MAETPWERESRLLKEIQLLRGQLNAQNVQIRRLHGQISHPSALTYIKNSPVQLKIYDQNDEPDLESGYTAFWIDADGGPKYYLVCNFNGVQKKVELT